VAGLAGCSYLTGIFFQCTGQAIENLQATLEATKGAAEKPSLTGALKENAGKVKEQPAKPATSKNEQAR
jgi:stage V sporulation protein G